METVTRDDIDGLVPEARPFRAAVLERSPVQGTACTAWVVRDILAHNAATAEELTRVLAAHTAGGPVPATRPFEEREPPYRALPDRDLLSAFDANVRHLVEVAEVAERDDPEAMVAWTGRRMKVRWFREHLREELALHRWDITGDDEVTERVLAAPWLTAHSVIAVGAPLLRRGMDLGIRTTARLRTPGRPDIVVEAGGDQPRVALVEPEGDADLEADAATRVLVLWGRRPPRPDRLASAAGPARLGLVRELLSGY